MERRTLEQWREKRLLSREELASRAGVAINTVWTAETGRNRPQMRTLRKLCEALDIDPEQIEWPEGKEADGRRRRQAPEEEGRRAA